MSDQEKFDTWPGKIPGWALDFPRAISNRPWWARLLFWFALGEAGRHEFWGLAWSILDCGLGPWEFESEWRSKRINKMPLFWRETEPKESEI